MNENSELNLINSQGDSIYTEKDGQVVMRGAEVTQALPSLAERLNAPEQSSSFANLQEFNFNTPPGLFDPGYEQFLLATEVSQQSLDLLQQHGVQPIRTATGVTLGLNEAGELHLTNAEGEALFSQSPDGRMTMRASEEVVPAIAQLSQALEVQQAQQVQQSSSSQLELGWAGRLG
jgi:hypothetical protein